LFTLSFPLQLRECIYATTLINIHNYYYPWFTILSLLSNKQTNNLHLSHESYLSLYDLFCFIRYDVEGMVYNRDAYHELINKSVGVFIYIYIYIYIYVYIYMYIYICIYIYMYFCLISVSSYILIHHYNQIHYDDDHYHYIS